MSDVWDYAGQTEDHLEAALRAARCLCCAGDLAALPALTEVMPYGDAYEWRVDACGRCGWWRAWHHVHLSEGSLSARLTSAAAGALKRLDPPAAGAVEEARARLSAGGFSGVALAGAFGGLGYRVRVIAPSGESALNALLDGPKGELIGVRAAPRGDAVEVEPIRELLGARVAGGVTQALLASTGPGRTALVDGPAFCIALGIGRRPPLTGADVGALVKREFKNADYWSSADR